MNNFVIVFVDVAKLTFFIVTTDCFHKPELICFQWKFSMSEERGKDSLSKMSLSEKHW